MFDGPGDREGRCKSCSWRGMWRDAILNEWSQWTCPMCGSDDLYTVWTCLYYDPSEYNFRLKDRWEMDYYKGDTD